MYLIKNVALTRFIVSQLRGPQALESNSKSSRLLYAGCSVAILALGWVVANAAPVFYDLVGLIGALLCGPISFILPIVFLLSIQTLMAKSETTLEPVECQTQDEAPVLRASSGAIFRGVCAHVRNDLPFETALLMAAIVGFICLIMVTGSVSSIKDIHEAVEQGNATVFTC